MNEKNYKRKFEFQKNMIVRQSKQIEQLKEKVQKLELELEEKDRILNSVDSLRKELKQNVEDIKQKKEEYQVLINEVKNMKNIINKETFKNRWWLVKFLVKFRK